MTSRNETYKLIAKSLMERLGDEGDYEVGQDHNRLFLRLGSQVFAVTVDERDQFNEYAAKHGEAAAREQAKNFMATLPYPTRREDL